MSAKHLMFWQKMTQVVRSWMDGRPEDEDLLLPVYFPKVLAGNASLAKELFSSAKDGFFFAQRPSRSFDHSSRARPDEMSFFPKEGHDGRPFPGRKHQRISRSWPVIWTGRSFLPSDEMPTFRIVAWEIYLPALEGFHLRTNLTLSYAAFSPCLPKSRESLSPP